MIKAYNADTQGGTKLSPNFAVAEFACKDGSAALLVDDELVTILQQVRNYFQRPVTITSGYRNNTYNTKVGGSTKSQHMTGRAADIQIAGISPQLLGAYVETLLPKRGGIGVYPPNKSRPTGWVHVDTRPDMSRWTG